MERTVYRLSTMIVAWGKGWWDHAEEKNRKMEAFCFWSKRVFLEGNLDNIWLSGLG